MAERSVRGNHSKEQRFPNGCPALGHPTSVQKTADEPVSRKHSVQERNKDQAYGAEGSAA